MYIRLRLREALPERVPLPPQKSLLLRLAEYLCHLVSSIYLLVSGLKS